MTASLIVSAIFNLYITTGNLLLQNEATFTFSQSFKPYLDFITPISYNLLTRASVYPILKLSLDFNVLSLATNLVIYPTILLYFA